MKFTKIFKHNIIHKTKYVEDINKIKHLLLIWFVMLCCMMYGKHYNFSLYQDMVTVMAPYEYLYNDTTNVVFSSNIQQKDLKIIIPAKYTKIEVVDGIIVMDVADNIMIVAPENGVVQKINNLNSGLKSITILLNNNITCIIENIDVVGVKVGEIVKKGKEIATTRQNAQINMKILKDGKIIENIGVVKNIVVWTD